MDNRETPWKPRLKTREAEHEEELKENISGHLPWGGRCQSISPGKFIQTRNTQENEQPQ